MSKIIPFDKLKKVQSNHTRVASFVSSEQMRFADIEKRLEKINRLMRELKLMTKLIEEIKL